MEACPVGQRDILAEVHQGLEKEDETDKGQLSSDTHCQVMTTHEQIAGQNMTSLWCSKGMGPVSCQRLASELTLYKETYDNLEFIYVCEII